MKNILQKTSLWIAVLIASFSLIPASVLAVTGTVYFGPDGNTVTSGSEFYVEVKGNVPDPGGWWGGGATIRFTYDPTKLQFMNADDSGGVFRQNNNHNWANESGVVHYRAQIYINAPGVNDQKIIGARFKAIGTGTTTLTFASNTTVNDGPTTGTPKTFTILPTNCPSGQIGTPPNCSTPAPTPTPKPNPTPTPTRTPTPTQTPSPTPVVVPTPMPTTEVTPEPTTDNDGGLDVENVKTTISRQKNIITWSMSKPDVEPKLTYGLSKSNIKNEATITRLSDGSFEATLTDIKPGTLYYFAIKAATPDMLKSANYNGSFTSKGYPVEITVKQNGVLAPDAKVAIGARNFVSNKNATITAEFGDGKFEATVTPKNSSSSYASNIEVKKVTVPQVGDPTIQKLVLDGVIQGTDEPTSDDFLPIVIGILSGLIGLGLIVGFILYRRKDNEALVDPSVDSDLLITNYGNAIDDSRAQTPVPNLDVQMPTAPPEQLQTDQVPYMDQGFYDKPEQPAPAEYQQTETVDIPMTEADYAYTDVPTDMTTSNDLSAAPISHEDTSVDTAIGNMPTAPQQIDEQLSEQVIAVESIDNNVEETTNSEEAIYHPETGELDIIHSNHSPAQKSAAAPLQPDLNVRGLQS